MALIPNVTKERLKLNKVAFGLGIRMSRTVDVVRAAATSGFHYINIDLAGC
jgi:hypothetical protein